MTILGMALISVVTSRLVDFKLDIATSEIDRARTAVEQQIDATGSSSTIQVRLNSARAALTQRSVQTGETTAVYEPVLVVADQEGVLTTSPEGYRIPEKLRRFVSEDQVSYQFATIDRADGSTYNALVIGTPTEADIPGLQVYLVLSMESDESTLALVRGLLSAAGFTRIGLITEREPG